MLGVRSCPELDVRGQTLHAASLHSSAWLGLILNGSTPLASANRAAARTVDISSATPHAGAGTLMAYQALKEAT
jgi:hypothetical protein